MSEHARQHAGTGRTLALCLGITLGLAACGGGRTRATFVATNPPPQALRSRPVSEVALLDGKDPPALAQRHTEVGLIEVMSDGGWSASEQAAVRHALRERGAELGCDAVVLLGEIAWIDTVESSQASTERHGYRGVCIVYR
jgi:hypothetical protein